MQPDVQNSSECKYIDTFVVGKLTENGAKYAHVY